MFGADDEVLLYGWTCPTYMEHYVPVTGNVVLPYGAMADFVSGAVFVCIRMGIGIDSL